MHSIDLASRENGDLGVARNASVANASSTTSSDGASKVSPNDVIDLLSDGDDDDDEEEEEEEEVVEVSSAAGSKCLLVVPHQQNRDINDNTGVGVDGVKPIEKRASLFERRSYQNSDRYIPGAPCDISGPGASFSRLSIYRRQSIHASPERRPASAILPADLPTARLPFRVAADQSTPRSSSGSATTSTSGIILNRAYKKTPTIGGTVARSAANLLVRDSPVPPIICLDDVRPTDALPGNNGYNTASWHNRHGHVRAGSSMSQTSPSFTPRSNFLRRSFHKLTTSVDKVLTIDLVEDAPPQPKPGSSTTPTSSRCGSKRIFTKNLTPPRLLSREASETGADTTQWMDICEVEDTSVQEEDPLLSTACSSSSSIVDLFVNADGSPEKRPLATTIVSADPDASLVEQAGSGKGDEEAIDQVSSLGNSYGDVSSSGCLKNVSTRDSVGRRQGVRLGAGGRQPLNEFDLMLLKINQTVPPMSHKDRIDQWRVTADDLLHSIPTKAAIETSSTCAKRPRYSTVHISSDDDSDNLVDATEEGPCSSSAALRTNKKRRTLEGEEEVHNAGEPHDADGAPVGHGSGLDFRKSQINPEIDKPHRTGGTTAASGGSMIMIRKNYHKLPTRFRGCDGTHHPERSGSHPGGAGDGRRRSCGCPREESSSCSGSLAGGGDAPGKPYAHLLSRDRERDKFLSYLQISPFFRTDEKALGGRLGIGEKGSADGDSLLDEDPLHIPEHDRTQLSAKAKLRQPMMMRSTKHRDRKERRKKPPRNKTHPSVIASSGLRGVRRLVLSSSLRSGKVIRFRNNVLNLRPLAKPKPKLAGRGQGRLAAESVLTRRQKAVAAGDTRSRRRASVPKDTGNGRPFAGVLRSYPVTPSLATVMDGDKRHQRRLRLHSASATLSSPLQRHILPSVPSASPAASVADKGPSKGRCSVDSAVSSSTSAEMRPEDASKRSKECQTVCTIPPLADALIEQRRHALPPPPATNDGRRLRNPIARTDGEVLHVFLIDEQLIVVQRELVSFWKHSRLSVLLGVKQDWQLVGQMQRWNRDTEVDVHNAHRVIINQADLVYLEPRARNLNDDKSRACPLASMYMNAYFLDSPCSSVPVAAKAGGGSVDAGECAAGDEDETGGTNGGEQVRMKSYQLDTVKSALEDIRLVPLPNSRDFIVCWHEHVSEMESRTGVCKYSLTPDLDTLGCIREFANVQQRLRSLKCMNDRKLIGLGQSTVHIWCYESGYLLRTVDLKIDLGLILCAFLHIEADESTLIMLQLQQLPAADSNNRKLVKVIAVNLYKPSWYTAHSYEIALASMSITSESPIWRMDEPHAAHQHCVTFDSGELLLVSLSDPTACWTNHQRLEKELLRAENGSVNICSRLRSNGSSSSGNDLYRPRERILNGCHWNGGCDLVFLSDQFLTTRTVDEYVMERAKDR